MSQQQKPPDIVDRLMEGAAWIAGIVISTTISVYVFFYVSDVLQKQEQQEQPLTPL